MRLRERICGCVLVLRSSKDCRRKKVKTRSTCCRIVRWRRLLSWQRALAYIHSSDLCFQPSDVPRSKMGRDEGGREVRRLRAAPWVCAVSSFGRPVICRRGRAFRATFAAEALTQLGVKDTGELTGSRMGMRARTCLCSLAILLCGHFLARRGPAGWAESSKSWPQFPVGALELLLLFADRKVAPKAHFTTTCALIAPQSTSSGLRGPSAGDATATEPNKRIWPTVVALVTMDSDGFEPSATPADWRTKPGSAFSQSRPSSVCQVGISR